MMALSVGQNCLVVIDIDASDVAVELENRLHNNNNNQSLVMHVF